MKANFEMLRKGWPELAELGGSAEIYAHVAPCFVDPCFKEPYKSQAGNHK
jgi:hypothetical protein